VLPAKRLQNADHIICLGPDGRIEHQGALGDISKSSGYITSLSSNMPTKKSDNDDEDGQSDSHDTDSESGREDLPIVVRPKEGHSDGSVSSSDDETPRENEDDLSRRTGDVQIYLYYVKSVGVWATLLFVAAIVGFVFCISFPSKFSGQGVQSQTNRLCRRLGSMVGCRQRDRSKRQIGVLAGGLRGARRCCHCLSVSELLVRHDVTQIDAADADCVHRQIIVTMVPRSGENFHFALLKTVLKYVTLLPCARMS